MQTLALPFPETNFQPILTQLPGLGVEAVGSFFAGGGAVQFVRDYAAAGLLDKTGRDADVYAVQGYDAAQLLAAGLDAVKGDLDADKALFAAMARASTARAASSPCRPRTTRCRAFTCARPEAGRTR